MFFGRSDRSKSVNKGTSMTRASEVQSVPRNLLETSIESVSFAKKKLDPVDQILLLYQKANIPEQGISLEESAIAKTEYKAATVKDGNKQLRKAASKGNLQAIKYLVDTANVDPGTNNNLALRTACKKGMLEAAETLLNYKGVNPTVNESVVLRKAARDGDVELVALLLKDGRADAASHDNEALRLAAANGHQIIVKMLLKNPSVNPTAKNNESLFSACKNGYQKVVKLLLKDTRINVSSHIDKALALAIQARKTDVVVELLKDPRLADDNIQNHFELACSIGNNETVRTMLDLKKYVDKEHYYYVVDPTANNNKSIRTASENGHLKIVDELLSNKDVNPGDNENDALFLAARNGHAKVVERLIMDKRVLASDGANKALEAACFSGHKDVVALILAAARDRMFVDLSVTKHKHTLLHIAGDRGYTEIVKMLLKQSDANPKDNAAT